MSATAILLCLIVGISDGDTLTARCEAQQGRDAVTLKVRLSQIDAPEKDQAFGKRSRQHLSELCFRKKATLAPVAAGGGLDRYGRTVARVVCDGADANAEQVRAGMAWVFDRYATDASLYKLQVNAKVERRGLWRDDGSIAPWSWRKGERPD